MPNVSVKHYLGDTLSPNTLVYDGGLYPDMKEIFKIPLLSRSGGK